MDSTRAFPAMEVFAVASAAWRACAQRACPPEPPRVSTRAAVEARWSSARTTRARTRITKPWRSTRRRPSSIATSSVCVSSAPTNNAHALTPGRDDRVSPPRLFDPTRHTGDSDATATPSSRFTSPRDPTPVDPLPRFAPVDLTRPKKHLSRFFEFRPARSVDSVFDAIATKTRSPRDSNVSLTAPPRAFCRRRLPRNPPQPNRRDAAHDAGGHRPPARRRGRDVHVRHAAGQGQRALGGGRARDTRADARERRAPRSRAVLRRVLYTGSHTTPSSW